MINSAEPIWGYPLLTFEVGSSDQACGESDIKLDGQKLHSTWTGFSGVGEGLLGAYGDARVLWTIQCIYTSTLSDEAGSLEKNGVQVFALTVVDSQGRQTTPGFTVSYRQAGKPFILHFEPRYIIVGGDERRWQVPSLLSTAVKPDTDELWDVPKSTVSRVHNDQKTILSHIKDVKDSLKDKVHAIVGKLKKICHEEASNPTRKQADLPEYYITDGSTMRNETRDIPVKHGIHNTGEGRYSGDEGSHDEALSASPVSQAKAAATRSADATEPNVTGYESPSHNGVPSLYILKVFFIGLSLFAFFTWIWLWHRDPRRRADRAARREEIRTKRLYRRAARKQKIKNFLQNTRVQYGLLYYTVVTWSKKGEAAAQEEITEDVMKDDIRALRNAHRVVSSMTGTDSAAEEGHAGYDEVGGSRLRSSRSVSTLPGYESEGAGPPGYTSEFNSDSSVVSTSPRISLSSGGEYDEKVEYINLSEERSGVAAR